MSAPPHEPIVKYNYAASTKRRFRDQFDDHPEYLFLAIFGLCLLVGLTWWIALRIIVAIFDGTKRAVIRGCKGTKEGFLRIFPCLRRKNSTPGDIPASEWENVELQTGMNPPPLQHPQPIAPKYPRLPPPAYEHMPHAPPQYQRFYERIDEFKHHGQNGRFTNNRRASQDRSMYPRGTYDPRRY